MISTFDIYDFLPRSDCGKCMEGSCMAMARAVAEKRLKVTECTWIEKDDTAFSELFDMLREEGYED